MNNHNFIIHEEINKFDLELIDNKVNLLLTCTTCYKEFVGRFELKGFYENRDDIN